jgi:hypothetical protein
MRVKTLLLWVCLASPVCANELPEAPIAKVPVKEPVIDHKFIVSMALLGGAAAADYTTTSALLTKGWAYERDPLYGRHPSNARLAGEGAAFYAAEITGAYLLKRYGQKHHWARNLWLVQPSWQTGAHSFCAIHNAYLRPK